MASPRPRRTPRRQSAAVYRRRRLVVGTFAVIVLVGLWWAGAAIFALFVDEDPNDPTAQETDPAGESAQGEASETDDPDGDGSEDAEDEEDTGDEEPEGEDSDGSCAPGDVRVTAATDEDTYGATVAPVLILAVENTGAQECTLDVGTAEQEFEISHAGRQVFTTEQCGDDGDSYELTMEPGQQERAQLTWPRSDSSETCTEPAELESGTYELTVSIGGITSDPHRFTLD
ncbi:DUF4232 domain-containing protein [Nesterenkonia xinjiangensis]|uniref:DUF4232 domain-containing protein n=1 Tax=Nesterenkonia xinjiangensis TaxID=225327 RepID=A0A7Z0K917_9MICC|nr:DUF4232 domain-containing protein [Nesterenkonia xinjiangensis]NYJ78216.1 hypothetical protein [Nesterenkonia xinjiangensis]